ncbi:glycoside hydrolase family 2 protein [Paenibacillus eucommiae]|uniref:Beta-glucuronidase n=1 Tax=Paenibacillus eucommiae TaxID=1355755 RepID=A0ABS4J212_9BACL|nr:glycoside hydrolase family 2 TIM barrel-domain containing protein [Paenibacillus eucommiae]MBP1993858.1 beta-glucuronidase [Paenibacillus eucommiae]
MKRNQVELREWQYQVDQDNLGETRGWFQPEWDKSGWLKVEAPQPRDYYEKAFWSYEGIGWYAAEVTTDLVDLNSLQKIVFNSVSGHARVWINGTYLGEHYGTYLPFEFWITPYLEQNGKNEIVMRVDNRHREEWLPGGPVVEWVQYGGILQKVTIDSIGFQHVSSLQIRTAMGEADKAVVICEMEIANRTDTSLEGIVQLELPEEKQTIISEHAVQCGPNESTIVQFEIEVSNAELWSLESPYLYTLGVKLTSGQMILDEVSQRFGIRTIESVGNQILLNGKPIMIKGFNRYDEYAEYGPNVPESVIREDLLKIKSTGANLVRVHYPQAPVHLDIMDEIGLLFMEEVPLNWWLSEGADRTFIPEVVDLAEKALEEMIRRDWNHPCVIAWSMCNESGTNSEDGDASVRRLMRRAKELDPSRLVTFVTIGSKGHDAFEEADLVCINLYYGLFHQKLALEISELEELVRKPTEKHLKETAEEYPGKPVVLTEFGTHGILGLKGNTRFSETYQAAYLEQVWTAVIHSGVQGGVVWCWADYYHRRSFIGDGEVMWNSPYGPYGVVTIDRQEKEGFDTVSRLFKLENHKEVLQK